MDTRQQKEFDVLTAEIFKDFRHVDVSSINIHPAVGSIEVKVDILRDKYDCALIKEFAEKDLQISRKHPNMRIHFEYYFIVRAATMTMAGQSA